MYQYSLYGMKIQSDLEFVQLCPWEEGMAAQQTITISERAVPKELADRADCKYEFRDNYSWLTNKTAWIVAENGRALYYTLKEGGRKDYLKAYLLGFGMAMLAAQMEHRLAVHCSVVSDENGAILIAGNSGAGKSTVSSKLLQQGYRFMADDVAFVEPRKEKPALVYAAFPYQKLCRDAALAQGFDLKDLLYIDEEKDKFLVPRKEIFSNQVQPVKALMILGKNNGDDVKAEEVQGIQKLYGIVNNLFVHRLLGTQCYGPHIGPLCLMAAAEIPIYYISRPREKDTTEKVQQAISQCLLRIR